MGLNHLQLRQQLVRRLGEVLDAPEAVAEASRWLCEGLGRDRTWLATHGSEPVSALDLQRVDGWLERRLLGEPWPMILGWTAFRGRRFRVRQGVLIPQSESEAVVTAALEVGHELGVSRCVDVGAGAGNIGISLALETSWSLSLAELDPLALRVAQENAVQLGARVSLFAGDLLDPVPDPLELVVANLPFVPEGLAGRLRLAFRFEPAHTMLSPGGTGLAARLLGQAHDRRAWACLVEIGAGQGEQLRREALAQGWARVEVRADACGLDRLLLAWR